MPRTSRKRNTRRNASTVRVTSNLSANAPEFIPIANDETPANQRENLVTHSMTLRGSSSASISSGSNSNSNNEANTTISSIPDALNNKGQRDLLINLLNECKVDCVICYERVKNVEPIWSCRNCYQVMHLKCIIVWYIKSHCNATWRCPACQSEVSGKPKYLCFCGTLPNPYHNNVDIPHSCGQVCGLPRKNFNVNYDDCHHKCTLLCHPGPCPQCVVQVLRSCGCGKKKEYAQCGRPNQVLCNKVCQKKLNCQIHECEKICHPKNCGPCTKGCPQQRTRTSTAALALFESSASFAEAVMHYNRLPPESIVTPEELRALGLNPDELLAERNDDDSDVGVDDFDVEVDVDDIDEIMQEIDFGYRSNSSFPVVLSNPLSGYSGSHEFDVEFPVADDDGDDDDDDDDDDIDDDTGEDEEIDGNNENNENNEGCVSNYCDSHDPGANDGWDWADSSSREEREIFNTSSPMDSEQSGDHSWDMSDDSSGEGGVIAGTNSSYSEDSTDSSQSGVSYLNDSISTTSNPSSGSGSGSCSSSCSEFSSSSSSSF